MKTSDELNIFDSFCDDFDFTAYKKYLSLHSQAGLSIINDHLYPLLKYGDQIIFEKAIPQNLRALDLLVFWDGTRLWPCLLKKKISGDYFEPLFLKESPISSPSIPLKHLIGVVTRPRLGALKKLSLRLKLAKKIS